MAHRGQEGLFESALGALLFMLLLGQDKNMLLYKGKMRFLMLPQDSINSEFLIAYYSVVSHFKKRPICQKQR
jgi:hypothetical protein